MLKIVFQIRHIMHSYNALLASWKLLIFDLSDISDISFKLIGYYETILFDIFYTKNKSDSNLENIDKLLKSTHASTVKSIYELYGDCFSKGLKELQKDNDEDEYNKMLNSINNLGVFKNAFSYIGSIGSVVGYCTDINDILYKCAVLETTIENNVYTAEILKDISELTTDTALKIACNNFADICSESISQSEITDIFLGRYTAKEVSNKILSTIWDKVVESCTSYGLPIKVGQGHGQTLLKSFIFHRRRY